MSDPSPYWVLRQHSPNSVQDIHIDSDRQLLIAGDGTGNVSITHLPHLRQHAFWKAHSDAILGVQLCGSDHALSHGRDNRLILWRLPPIGRRHNSDLVGRRSEPVSLPSRLASSLPLPQKAGEIEVNALNFARFSFLSLDTIGQGDLRGLVAVPHTLDAAYFDVFELPSGKRVFEAVSKPDIVSKPGSRLPIIMSMHLFRPETGRDSSLACLTGYEDGCVKLWRCDDGKTWSLSWERRLHSESVMDIARSHDCKVGVSISADDRISRFRMLHAESHPTVIETGKAGRASVSIRGDGKVCATGGWDSRIRLYDLETMQELGSLQYHRDTVETLTFFEVGQARGGLDSDSDSDAESDSSNEHKGRHNGSTLEGGGTQGKRWALAAGGRDGKISLWHVF